MPLLMLARFVAGLLSLVLLGVAAWLLWTWQRGELIQDAAGAVYRIRDDWRLWTGLGLLAWSFLGRLIAPRLLARPGGRKTSRWRGDGQMIASRTGSSLYTETYGPAGAPPIIFTHGWGMDGSFWDYARQDLGDRFRLVFWDLPGLGHSKAADKDAICLPAFAEDLVTLIEVTGRQPVVLVGHSIGGMTLQTLIRDHPQLQSRIAGLVLLNTTYTNPLKTMVLSGLAQALRRPVIEPMMRLTQLLHPLAWAMKWQSYLSGSAHMAHRLGFGGAVTRSQLEHATRLSTRNPPAVLAQGDLAMFRWDATDALRDLRIPALVIGGDIDIVTKLEASRTIAGESALASLEVVPGANHLGPLDQAERYNRLIAEFALGVQPGASDLRPADALTPDAWPASAVYEPRTIPPGT